MKKISFIKKVLPIIFLLLLLFLIPLFKSNYNNEYFCNYNLNNIIVEEPYNCEGDFLDKYRRYRANGGLITTNGGPATDCLDTITSLLNELDLFYRIKQQIPDTSVCELAVAQEKIENLTNLIKMKLLSMDSCEISYEQYLELEAQFSTRSHGNIDANVLADIKYYALKHAVKDGEEEKFQQKIDKADLCLGYNRENSPSDCSVKGDNILGLPHYSATPIEYTLDVNDLLL